MREEEKSHDVRAQLLFPFLFALILQHRLYFIFQAPSNFNRQQKWEPAVKEVVVHTALLIVVFYSSLQYHHTKGLKAMFFWTDSRKRVNAYDTRVIFGSIF